MTKAILIGNGFTLNLIRAYRDNDMMTSFSSEVPGLVHRVDEAFEVFRDVTLKNNDLYNVVQALYPSEDLYPSDDLYPRDNQIHPRNEIRQITIRKLEQLGFISPESIYDTYFVACGLLYSINKRTLVGVESYLKVAHMYIEQGLFARQDYEDIQRVATNVYFNFGKHGIRDVDNSIVDVEKIKREVRGYAHVFTTNYDTILDDILEEVGKFPYHLHGGFSVNHKNKNPDGRYGPDDAKLVWGINAGTKYRSLASGFDYSDFNYAAMRYGQSQLADYFDILEHEVFDEIHILGFSGENDGHVNQRIQKNRNIKTIVVYVKPDDVETLETRVRKEILFGGDLKRVALKSWDGFWSRCEK